VRFPDGALRLFLGMLAWIDRAAGGAVIVLMAVMVVVVSSQVFMRYVLNQSFDWADETARLCFIWTIFLSIPLALDRGGHIVMELLVTRVAPYTRDLLYRAMGVLVIGMMILIAREAWRLTLDNWDDTIPSLGWSGGLFFLPIFLSCVHTTLRLIAILMTGEPRRQGIIE
jgi:TRAP-type C4-dicarboxylate transport system permease small subunit